MSQYGPQGYPPPNSGSNRGPQLGPGYNPPGWSQTPPPPSAQPQPAPVARPGGSPVGPHRRRGRGGCLTAIAAVTVLGLAGGAAVDHALLNTVDQSAPGVGTVIQKKVVKVPVLGNVTVPVPTTLVLEINPGSENVIAHGPGVGTICFVNANRAGTEYNGTIGEAGAAGGSAKAKFSDLTQGPFAVAWGDSSGGTQFTKVMTAEQVPMHKKYPGVAGVVVTLL